jgi:undecaprenyl-diphosphatase
VFAQASQLVVRPLPNNNYKIETTNLPKALRIGLFQVTAMVPGVSRSAPTIIGGLMQGFSPVTAAE